MLIFSSKQLTWTVKKCKPSMFSIDSRQQHIHKTSQKVTEPGFLLGNAMYGIFTYIYHKNQPNVGIYIIHGSYGLKSDQLPTRICFRLRCLSMQPVAFSAFWWLASVPPTVLLGNSGHRAFTVKKRRMLRLVHDLSIRIFHMKVVRKIWLMLKFQDSKNWQLTVHVWDTFLFH